MLNGMYKLESVWLEHIGCKFKKADCGFSVSNPHNTSEDFNYFLLKKLPPKAINFPTIKIRQSDDKNLLLSKYLMEKGFEKTTCDDVQLVYRSSCQLADSSPPVHFDPAGLKVEISEPKDWIENNKYDLNRDFSVGAFSPVKLVRDKTVIGRANLLRLKRFIGIFDLFIEKKRRGAGIGRWFLAHLLRNEAGELYFIQTWEKNSAALKLYTSLGFKIADRYLYFSKSG